VAKTQGTVWVRGWLECPAISGRRRVRAGAPGRVGALWRLEAGERRTEAVVRAVAECERCRPGGGLLGVGRAS
jgi:hypothetical protein